MPNYNVNTKHFKNKSIEADFIDTKDGILYLIKMKKNQNFREPVLAVQISDVISIVEESCKNEVSTKTK